MSAMLTATLLAALFLAPVAPAEAREAAVIHAQDTSNAFPPSARVKVAFSLPMELHNLLMVATEEEPAPGFEKQIATYKDQITVYKEARQMIVEPLAWRFINDAILEGPDMPAIAARATQAPASLGAMDATGIQKILAALAAAWPKFEKQDLDSRRVSLQKLRLRLEKLAALFEPRVMPVIYDKLALTMPDAPVTVYPVIDALDAGVIGRTSAGYYLVIPTTRRPDMVILETMFHEMTHLLDSIQPADKRSIMRKVRASAKGKPASAVEEMLHGLVTYNSGVVLQRFGKPDYTPMVNASPSVGDRVAKYRNVFDGAWSDYLSGKIDEDAVVKALVGSIGAPKGTGTSS